MSNKGKRAVSDSALLAAIVESSSDAIITKDLNGIITSWNRAAEQFFGYTAREAIGQPITMLIPEDRIDEEPGILARIRRGESVDHYDTIRRTKDGRLIDISLNISPIHGENGVIIGASKIARDITARKRVETELNKLASIVEFASDAIITKDLNGIITSWNRGAQNVFGYTPDEIIGKHITVLMPEDRVNEEPGIIARIRRGESVDHYQTVRRRKDGRLVDISLNVSPVRDSHGVIVGASKIARDVTEHNRVERAERETEIMHRLIETQEAERRRIARDLHDHIGQYMTAMRLTLEGLVDRTAGDDAIQGDLLKIKDIATRIDRDLSFLTWELRPTELELLGLKDAIRSFVNEWADHNGIEAAFDFVGESESSLDALIETNIYRITQEALNNIAKHAEASRVSVLMHRHAAYIFMIVEDNGKGFDPPSVPAITNDGHGMGLLGMRERAELLGGKLLIESVPGRGTTIIVRVPLERLRTGGGSVPLAASP